MATKTEQYLDSLTAKGELSFTVTRFCHDLKISHSAALSAINRLKEERKVASPSKGYYLIVTPEFRHRGCLPADFFIDDLMRHLGIDYYVCLLSASMFHGAAHQQPQMLQVMLSDKRENIRCGENTLEFIKNRHLSKMPTQKLKTRTGYMKVSTPEATAMDMLKYMRQSGGINRIATVIHELAETMDDLALAKLADDFEGSSWVNRLGYLLDRFGYDKLADSLYEVFDKKARIRSLAPYITAAGAPRDKKWRLAINVTVESDLDDTY